MTPASPPPGFRQPNDTSSMPADLLVVGVSARAAAQSARRAGIDVVAADWFADRDLVECCPTQRIASNWRGLYQLFATRPALRWLYTGGLENHPRRVDRLQRMMPLVGNGLVALRNIRNPLWLQQHLIAHGFPFPETYPIDEFEVRSDCLSTGGSETGREASTTEWLIKPVHSAGGARVRWLHATPAPHRSPDGLRRRATDSIVQRHIRGQLQSASFLATGSSAHLLGVTEQWAGLPWLFGREFQYCGSIGPVTLSPNTHATWSELGSLLVRLAQLRGLFGVDAVVTAQGEIWPLEVNPRYCASMEVLELASNSSFLATALQADDTFDHDRRRGNPSQFTAVADTPELIEPRVQFGKAILYAPSTVSIEASWIGDWERTHRGRQTTWLADLPWPGSTVQAGHPVLTILARGHNANQVRHQLAQAAHSMVRRLNRPHSALPGTPFR